MKKILLLFFACLALGALGCSQDTAGTTTAPGSSLPGFGGLPLSLDGPGYIEAGYGHSDLTDNYSSWNDFYTRGMVSGGRNAFTGELTRQARFGDNGWFLDLGWNRTLSPAWYMQLSAGSSVGGFFLPKLRTDALINRKLLRRRQLVATLGVGYDQSKTVGNDIRPHDLRAQVGGAYYFEFPIVLQGGFMWTHADPGDVLARTQYLAINQGHDKEHFVSLRYEWGREGYEILEPSTTAAPAPNVLFNFPEHTITGTWRQWVGPNWGFNLNIEQHQEPAYHRLGGTLGVFLDF
jgi:YaiO family outer membrane protein